MDINKVIPVNDTVFVEPLAEAPKSATGIVLPKEERPAIGVVVVVKKNNLGMKKGSKVLFKKWNGTEYKFEGKTYMAFKYEDILGVLE